MSLAPQRRLHACPESALGKIAPSPRRANPFLTPSFIARAFAVAAWLAAAPALADIVEMRPAASKDDAEERADLSMYTGSSDLELVFDTSNQVVGIRWPGLAIPAGSTITAAWVQFTPKESQSELTTLTIAGQAADSPLEFGTTAGNISLRPRTAETVGWSPAAWTAGAATLAQRTPDLTLVIQKIVSRAGWASGNALVLIITGTGHRTAYAFDGGAAQAPLLHVEFTSGGPPPPPPVDNPPVAALSVTQLASPALTVSASGAGSTDTDATPIASYQFAWGDGSTATTTTAPTSSTTHTYAASGTYTVTLVATDTGGLASAPVTQSITVNPAPPPVDNPPVAALSVTQLASPALTVSASSAGSTDGDATPIWSYQFSWGDGSAATTTTAPTSSAPHTYAAAGTYIVSLVCTDTGSLTSNTATFSITVTAAPPPGTTTIDVRPVTVTDDAEESATGSVATNSSDLELVFDGSNQTVGIRWPAIPIDPGANISAAWVQFTADESQSEVTNLTIRGQAAANAAAFSSTSLNISSRPRTAAAVAWSPAPWTAGQVGAAQKTTDIKSIVQEIVSSSGWARGNALALIFTGTGHRTAVAVTGNSSRWAVLHVEFSGGTPPPDQPPVARLTVSQIPSPAFTVTASGATSTDTDATPIASYRFTWGDGSAATVVSAPTSSANHTYAAAGTYTVTLTATDTGGLISSSVSQNVLVSTQTGPPIAVYASYNDTHHSYNTQPKPSPWMGSPNVVFVGTPDSPSGGWDSSGLKIDNLSGGSLTMTVTVDMISKSFNLWGSRTIPAGQSLILAQTGYENFDGSDTSPAGCYGCNPNLCLTSVSSAVPVVSVTINGTTTKYYDPQQTLNTNGVDYAGCPATSGRNDESRPWVRIYPTAPGQAAPTASNMFEGDPNTTHVGLSWVAPPFPNPTRGTLTLQFNTGVRGRVELAIYDVAGRLVRTEMDHEFEVGQWQKMIPLRGLTAGMYYCTLRTPEGTLKQSFIVAP